MQYGSASNDHNLCSRYKITAISQQFLPRFEEFILPLPSCQVVLDLALKLQECLLVMTGDDSTPGCCFQTLETLGTAEPGWVVSC